MGQEKRLTGVIDTCSQQFLKFFAGLCCFLFVVWGCKSPSVSSLATEQVFFRETDSYGREVILATPPKRIISLSPCITEMIFELQSGNKLVGISDFCDYPTETDTMTKVGGMLNFSIEHILSLRPDIVLIGSIVQQNDVQKMEDAGLKVFAAREEQHLSGMYHTITLLGKMLQRDSLACEKVREWKSRIASLDTLSGKMQTRPSVYYVVGFGNTGDYTAPKNSHIHEMITLAGGRNVGEPLSGWSVSREYLIQQNPDMIFIRQEDFKTFLNTKPYIYLSAVKNENVYPITSSWIDVSGPRNFWAIKMMNRKIKAWEHEQTMSIN
ncbi:MAG: ABC transporter substrate-binding protein [Bacteroidales bacterium]|jgi:iron complex transport system substrate-binding protein|nr:ABC transporter substrate-binding protein [Bacteroidales bacterium]